jgi:hypothetical protein
VVLIKQCWFAARPVFGDGLALMRGYISHGSDDDLMTSNGTYRTLSSRQHPLTKSDVNTFSLIWQYQRHSYVEFINTPARY